MQLSIEKERIEVILRRFVNSHRSSINKLKIEGEDFIQDVYVNLMVRKGLVEYDDNKVLSFEAFINCIAKRYLTDLNRKRFSKTRKDYSEVSLEGFLREEERKFDPEDYRGEEEILMFEVRSSLPEKQISPNYRLTWRELFVRITEETPEEIAKSLGISSSRVRQLIEELREKVEEIL